MTPVLTYSPIIMKKYIKIALIAVVVLGIAGLTGFYLKSLGEGADARIPQQAFDSKIAARVDQHIKGKDYNVARVAFDSLLTCIETERAITLSTGEPAAKQSEITHAKQSLFDGFAPIFVAYANNLFAQATWNEDYLRQLQAQAQALSAMGVAERGTENAQNLEAAVRNVNDYFAARTLIASANNCGSVAAVQAIRSGVARYKHAPLTNNQSLMSALNSAPGVAKMACANALAARANRVCSYRAYSSYDSFYSAMTSIKEQISKFQQALGSVPVLGSALSNLSGANSNALSYFSSRISDDYYSPADSVADEYDY